MAACIIFFSFGLMSFCLGSMDPAFWLALSPPLALLCFFEKREKCRSDSAFQGFTPAEQPEHSAFVKMLKERNVPKSEKFDRHLARLSEDLPHCVNNGSIW